MSKSQCERIHFLSFRSSRLFLKSRSHSRISDRVVYKLMDCSNELLEMIIDRAVKEMKEENTIRSATGLETRKAIRDIGIEIFFKKNFFLKKKKGER